MSKMRLALSILAVALATACGKKPAPEAAESAPPPPAPKQSVSIDGAGDAPPPPPVVSASDPAAPPPEPAAPTGTEGMTAQQIEQYYKSGEQQERAYEKRLARNGKWLEAIKKDPSSEQRVLAEIRAARLTPAEIDELEGIKQYFGVKTSFR